jgi:serpin B
MRWRKLKYLAAAAAVLVAAALVAPFGVSAWAGGGQPSGTTGGKASGRKQAAGTEAAAAAGAKRAARKRVAATVKQKQEVVREANAFAFDLYAKVRADKEQAGENVFFSPFSISSALAMTYAGAMGNTAGQMAKVMHFDLKKQELHPAFSDLTANLNKRGKAGSFKLAVANRLWGQKTYHFLQNFLEMNKLYYGAGIERLSFAKDPDGSRRTINAWVEKQTQDKIKDLLQPGDINADTRLVLTNAIYFKGDWEHQFKKKWTRDRDFNVSATERVKVPMMTQSKKFAYAQCDGYQALELPYKGEELSMVVLLPGRKSSLAALEKKLTAKALAGTLRKMRKQKVVVSLPRFEMEWRLDLKATLAAMGMVDAFSGRMADFSGMTGYPAARGGLYITKVIHKAFVAVDEKGTEAAAATAVVMAPGCAAFRPISFTADRPFVFMIRDKKTGGILFLGRVVNPKS